MTTTLTRPRVRVPKPRYSQLIPGFAFFYAPLPEELSGDGAVKFWEAVDAGVYMGRQIGIGEGYKIADEEISSLQRAGSAIARDVQPPYATLCERRGEFAKAAANRALLRERGISFD